MNPAPTEKKASILLSKPIPRAKEIAKVQLKLSS